jgi:glycosyltransferase involved in cell wall biosynthesis
VDAVRPQFSVCIPAYADLGAFSRCLATVLGQKGVSLECVVSDDSGTDKIAEHTARQDDGRIAYHRNRPALGAPENWNRAIGLARGEYVTLLHQDDWYRSDDALKTLYETFQSEGADALFCGRALYRGDICLGEYPLTLKKLGAFRRGFPGRTLVVNTLGHPGVAFFHRRHSGVRYDAALLYFSDTEHFARLICAAGRVAVCEKPLVAIARGGEQLSAGCLARPEALVPELAYALRKHRASGQECGLALARFFAGNARHWRQGALPTALRSAREQFSLMALCLCAASLPVFLAHMLYRAAYRRVRGRAWG